MNKDIILGIIVIATFGGLIILSEWLTNRVRARYRKKLTARLEYLMDPKRKEKYK